MAVFTRASQSVTKNNLMNKFITISLLTVVACPLVPTGLDTPLVYMIALLANSVIICSIFLSIFKNDKDESQF